MPQAPNNAATAATGGTDKTKRAGQLNRSPAESEAEKTPAKPTGYVCPLCHCNNGLVTHPQLQSVYCQCPECGMDWKADKAPEAAD